MRVLRIEPLFYPSSEVPERGEISPLLRCILGRPRLNWGCRVDLPAQANFLACARSATGAFSITTAPQPSNLACLSLLRFRVRVAVPDRGRGCRWAPLAEAGNNVTVGKKQSVTVS